MTSYETVIGLEIHIQLLTNSKAFCNDTNHYPAEPNTNVSVISMAHPGTMPVLNKSQLNKAILLGLAFGCQINKHHFFDRKNYFYPDLPKGYQITQDKVPYCTGGEIRFLHEDGIRTIQLHHIHMEEDAGKSIHDQNDQWTLLDYNRAGVPLLEIVTEPDFRSGQEVSDFLAELQKVVKYLDISDGNMEEGSFRCDCNVSVRKKGTDKLGERCEIKNMNSRRFAKNAIESEALRQINILENGGKIEKTTMLYDPIENVTKPMRKKESENDYRYFTEPDLPPTLLTDDYLTEVSKRLITLPLDRYIQLKENYGLAASDAELLTEDVTWSNCFFSVAAHTNQHKEWSELLIHKIIPYLKTTSLDIHQLGDETLFLRFIDLIDSKKVTKSAAYQYIFPVWIKDITKDPFSIASDLDLIKSENQDFLDQIIKDVLAAFPDKVAAYKKGQKGLIGFFMGQIKQKSGGKADPQVMQHKIETALLD